MILFHFPHCGEANESYLAWSKGLPDHAKLLRVELSQPGLSMRDISSAMWEKAVTEASLFVQKQLGTGEEFMFMGHCWGSLLAFEVSHRLKMEGGAQPAHLFLSGCSAPHLLRPRSDSTRLRMSAALACECEPLEDYQASMSREPLQMRFSIFAGKQDALAPVDQLAEWSRYTAKICDVHVCEGDHDHWQQDSMRWFQMVQTIVEREYAF
ncbi:thioesterase II family protein [Paenibacillus sp. N3.4]|uniref:thioesterase II family protein n=1 Tax=Paenibacillus sp. N3.4 TaxID=2603222 RepID=UPI0011C77E63|nr:thioesterase domain-containing protein [Paenibacillus sp. N3.4]TXK74856.1 hypothetical protein FU659_28225 [Paenibacillus sp. N3.4]